MPPEEGGVSRETLERLTRYADLIRKWNPTVNLVSRGDLEDLWSRHVLDSLRLHHAAPPCAEWLDLGSGGGFPGLVVAIARHGETRVTMVESDRRKGAFLRTVARELDLDASILTQRIEAVPGRAYPVVSARALAPLDRLLKLSARFGDEGTLWLFPKGQRADIEIAEARRHWTFQAEAVPSSTNDTNVLLKVRNPRHVPTE